MKNKLTMILLLLTVWYSSDSVAMPEQKYQGKTISLNYQNIPVRVALQMLADYNGFNLVTTDSVHGDLTLQLRETPWDQVLDIILYLKGLDKRLNGKVLLVATAEEFASREAWLLQSALQAEELELLQTAFLTVNYAKAAELAMLLSNQHVSLLSLRGSVSVDERTNTLLVQDTRSNIDTIRQLIQRLDIPVRQVAIEARMVTVRNNVSEELGIRWGMAVPFHGSGYQGSIAGSPAAAVGNADTSDGQWNVNLPVNNPAGSIALHIARLADGTLLDLELSALEKENKGEIIASPKITTANQKQARIEQGIEIPYVQSAASGATSVEFKKAVLSLTVTPHITPDNRIILDLMITQNTRGEAVQTPLGPATAIDTQQIQTQVLADDRETIVLGGIYQQQQLSMASKVPLLGDIPYVGRLFRSSYDVTEKSELLIFVTPQILQDSLLKQAD